MSALNEFEPDLTASKVAKTNVKGSESLADQLSMLTKAQGHAAQSRGPSPNRGASVPDFVAIGPESESQESWLKANKLDKAERVNIVKLSHMRYQHPDLQEITTFLRGKPAYCLVTWCCKNPTPFMD